MKYIDWSEEKNEWLKTNRGISFEDVVFSISQGGLLDRKRHENKIKFRNQWVFFVEISGYVFAVPFVEDDEKIFLKTIFPTRKATKEYLEGDKHETK